ncbi:voltage-gated potassium channel [Aureococcus anophagefferens]|nr:voltage-gated potassium channel [Aureococcus anophagefferens]
MANFSSLTDELGFMLAKAEIATPEPDKAETSEREPSQQLTAAGEALNASATWFSARAATTALGGARSSAASALTPWLDSLGCGITSMVNVNVAKLETRFGADDAFEEIELCEIITASYEDTLARHHNWAVRPAAKALLLMTPDRADLLADFGYNKNEWNTRARSDFAEFVAAVEACLGRLAAIYAPYDEAI